MKNEREGAGCQTHLAAFHPLAVGGVAEFLRKRARMSQLRNETESKAPTLSFLHQASFFSFSLFLSSFCSAVKPSSFSLRCSAALAAPSMLPVLKYLCVTR